MMNRFKLTRSAPEVKPNSVCHRNLAFSVQCEAALEGVDDNIFVYHVGIPNDPVHSEDTFFCVASLAQMQIFPTEAAVELALAAGENPFHVQNADGTEDNVPFYRTNSVDLTFNNATAMDHAWRVMKLNVAKLSREYNDFDKVKAVEEVVL